MATASKPKPSLSDLGFYTPSEQAVKFAHDPREHFLIEGLIKRQSLALGIGESGLGKSPWAYQAVICIAAEIPFCGLRTEKAKVLYADNENGPDDVNEIMDALGRFLGLQGKPKSANRPLRRVASAEQIVQVFAAVNLRERVILKLGGIAGMRPGEIFGLKWANLESRCADIRRRVYQGDIDLPKSPKSIRKAALGETLFSDIAEWKGLCFSSNPENWVFPSETTRTPLRPGNVWRRHIKPNLTKVGLAWVNFQVLRRSCSSILSDVRIEGKVVADQLGHTLDVNQNVYTRVGFDRQEDAIKRLDSALRVN